ncbi:hypothetical protein RchiOBHm_Chr6g0275271 [Rosa chinensis]|uniref:Uncharacterized protein n=1 Tax=Rosa chinensis TaxID=74649 RepID=A0A2P6PS15_ROSCH|nr:hypothetical protein RchiOBHm_Chr6g0275271 [Rosa chinensis]
MSTGIVTQFKEAGQSTMAAHQLWSKFTDSTAPSLPSSLFDASTRVFQNLTRFFFFTCLNQQFIDEVGADEAGATGDDTPEPAPCRGRQEPCRWRRSLQGYVGFLEGE